jgi:hypothetical protein
VEDRSQTCPYKNAFALTYIVNLYLT